MAITDFALSSERIVYKLGQLSFPIIAIHVDESLTQIKYSSKEMGDYLLDNHSMEDSLCYIDVTAKNVTIPPALAEENRSYTDGDTVLKYEYKHPTSTIYRMGPLTLKNGTNEIFECGTYTGYGTIVAIFPVMFFKGSGYDKLLTASFSVEACAYINFDEDPIYTSYDAMLPGCIIQPFGEPVIASFATRVNTYNLTEIDNPGSVTPPGPEPPTPGEDPYEKGGESAEGGGTGDFDNTSEDVSIPDLPVSSSVVSTGFITLYEGTVSELNALATYLWDPDGLDLDTFKKIFSDPISAILGLSIFPIPPDVNMDTQVILGNMSTGVNMRKIANQYKRFDCGTLNINEYWGGYLDYSPYTTLEIFLPYIGTRTLNTDDVMGKAVHLVYHIDFLSGACCAILEVNGTVLYQFMGQCSCAVPVTGRDMTNLINGVLSVVGAGVGSLVATGGNLAFAGAAAIGSLASSVTSAKPKVEKTGAMGSMGGMLGVRTAYITITRPRQALPSAQNRYTGYPSYISTRIGDMTGFTIMYEVHLKEMTATDEEKTEIERLLKSGVIL